MCTPRIAMSGTIQVCAACGTRLEVPERYLGRTVRCGSCGTRFVAGQSGSGSPEPGPETPASQLDGPAIMVRCADCGRKLRVREQHVGQRLRCPECGAVFVASRDQPPPAERRDPEQAPAHRDPGPRGAHDQMPQPAHDGVREGVPAGLEGGPAPAEHGAAEAAAEGGGYTHVCTACGSQMQVHARYLGRTLPCTTCRTEFVARPRPLSESLSTQQMTVRPEAGKELPSPPRPRTARRVVVAMVLLAGVVAVSWWLGTDRREGFAGELFTVRKARGELGVLRRGDGGAVIAALDRDTLGLLVTALARGNDAEVHEIASSPRCLELSTGTRVRVLERRKRAVEARVRILDGPWSSRIVWVHIDWIR